MDSKLRLNRENGMMEMVLTISIDRKAHLRRLMAYIEENNIDYTDLTQYQKALDKVSSLYEWQNHPDARMVFGQQQQQQPKQIEQPKSKEEETQKKIRGAESGIEDKHADDTKGLRWVNSQQEKELIARAMNTPIEEWDSLLTPCPTKDYEGNKQHIYQRRYDEKVILARLKRETEPAPLEKLQVVAEATNGARHR